MNKLLLLAGLLSVLVIQGCSNTRPTLPTPPSIESEVSLTLSWRDRVNGAFGESSERYNLVAEDGSLFFVTDEGDVYQIDQNNGKIITRFSTGFHPSAGVTRNGDILYFGTYDAQLVAVSLSSQSVLWEKSLSSEILSEPAYVSGKLAIQTADGWLTVLSSENGDTLWRTKEDMPSLTIRGTSAPVIYNGKVIAGFADGTVKAFGLLNGKQLWSYEVGKPEGRYEIERLSDVDGRLVVKDGVVYAVAYNGTVSAISVENGSPMWQRSIPSSVGVAVQDGLVVVVDLNSKVVALNAKNGSEVWENTTLEGRDLISPEFYRDYVAVIDRAGYVHLLNLTTGVVKGRFMTNSVIEGERMKKISEPPGSRMVSNGSQLFILTPKSYVSALSY